jgi:hypothetical protein
MMTFFKIIRNLFTNRNSYSFIPLGRWNVDYCNKTIDRKIYLANNDNCGKYYSQK